MGLWIEALNLGIAASMISTLPQGDNATALLSEVVPGSPNLAVATY